MMGKSVLTARNNAIEVFYFPLHRFQTMEGDFFYVVISKFSCFNNNICVYSIYGQITEYGAKANVER
jgi:hypothetical protein